MNLKQAKAIEANNKKRLLAINPNLDEESGIYFLTRTCTETGIKFSYIGQATHLLTRLSQHLSGYQHIDISLRKHGLFSSENPDGWNVHFLHFPKEQLDEKERYYITLYAKQGYQTRNKDTGGGAGKQDLGDRKPPKTYREGIIQGKKMLARELSHIAEKHLEIGIKEGKKGNKISINAFEKFNELLNECNYQ